MKRIWMRWAHALLAPFLAQGETLVMAVPGMDPKGIGSAGGQLFGALRGHVRSYVLGITAHRVVLLERNPFSLRTVRLVMDEPRDHVVANASRRELALISSERVFRFESTRWRSEYREVEGLLGNGR